MENSSYGLISMDCTRCISTNMDSIYKWVILRAILKAYDEEIDLNSDGKTKFWRITKL